MELEYLKSISANKFVKPDNLFDDKFNLLVSQFYTDIGYETDDELGDNIDEDDLNTDDMVSDYIKNLKKEKIQTMYISDGSWNILPSHTKST